MSLANSKKSYLQQIITNSVKITFQYYNSELVSILYIDEYFGKFYKN